MSVTECVLCLGGLLCASTILVYY